MRAPLRWVVLALAAGPALPVWSQDSSERTRFEFAGNQAVPAAELEEVVADERTRYVAQEYSEGVLDDAAYLVERHYRRLGYGKVRVDYEVVEPGARVVFHVEEGGLWYMAGPIEFDPPIEVPGFAEFWVRISIYALQRYVTAYPVYIENRMANDLDTAKDFLIAEGFVDVRFRTEVTEPPGEPHRVRVVVHQVLGPRTLVGTVAFEGRTLFPHVVLLAELGLHPPPANPVPWYPDRSIKWRIALVRFFRSKGYYRPEIEAPEPEIAAVGPGERRADLVFRIDPGERYRIRSVRVQGNEDLSEETIREAFGIEPGEWYSLRRVDRGRNDLIRLELFTTVSVLEEEASEGEVDLVILVQEKPKASFGVHAGYGVFDGVRAGAEFQYNNLLGTGRGFRVRGTASSRRRWAELKFVDPMPFNDGENRIEVGPFVERQEREPFVLDRVGAEFDFRRKIGVDLTFDAGWVWEFSDLRHLGDGLELSGEGDHYFSGPHAGIEWDLRDDSVNPTSGYRFGLEIESTAKAFGATKDLLGGGFQAELFYPVATFQGYPVVIYGGLRGRIVQPLGSSSVPIQKRLFEGGEYSVRSFEPDRLSPLNFLETPIGGEVEIVSTIETRFNIYQDLWGVVFADVGFVDSNLEEFGKEPPGLGFGAGLRYQTPIGPIRLEAAYNPDHDRSRDDDPVEIIFTIGFKF